MKLKSILFCASAMMLAGNSFGQYFVTTGTDKYVLLEEATGTWCGYCPDGAQDIEQSVKTNPKAIVASWHAPSSCSGSEGMMVVGNPFTCGTPYISGFPMGTIDRAIVSPSTTVGSSRPWSAKVSTRQSSTTASFKVDLYSTYDTTTRILTVKIRAKALAAVTGNYRMSLLLIEDSISSATYPQGSYFNTATTACNGQPSWWTGLGSPISPSSKYWHNSVVRALIDSNGSIWGDPTWSGSHAIGDSITKTYVDTLPSIYQRKFMKVIGMIQKYGSTTDDRAIENSIESVVKLMPKTAPAPASVSFLNNAMSDITIFPNPAQDVITVKGILENPTDTKITIYNAVGQVVFASEYKAGGSLFGENISVSNLSNGIYFMTITNNGESVTKQFSISK